MIVVEAVMEMVATRCWLAEGCWRRCGFHTQGQDHQSQINQRSHNTSKIMRLYVFQMYLESEIWNLKSESE